MKVKRSKRFKMFYIEMKFKTLDVKTSRNHNKMNIKNGFLKKSSLKILYFTITSKNFLYYWIVDQLQIKMFMKLIFKSSFNNFIFSFCSEYIAVFVQSDCFCFGSRQKLRIVKIERSLMNIRS